MINIEISNVKTLTKYSTREKERIINDLTFDNPNYQNVLRYSKWQSTKIPKYIKYYKEIDDTLIVPRGYVLNTPFKITQDNRINVNVEDYPKFNLKLRTAQKKAVSAYIKTEGEEGVIVLPTGLGKSISAIYLSAYYKQKTLVIVQKDDLIDGWKKDIQLALDLRPKQIGLIKAKKFRIGKFITLCTIQTLSKLEENELKELTKTFGMIVLDELHHIPAKSYEILTAFYARYGIGLTATPLRNDGLGDVLYHLFGKACYVHTEDSGDIISSKDVKIKSSSLPQIHYNPEPIYYVYRLKRDFEERDLVNLLPDRYRNLDTKEAIRRGLFGRIKRLPLKFNEVKSKIIYNEEFQDKIIRDVLIEYKKGKSCIIFCHEIQQCDDLYEKFKKHGVTKIQLFYGKSKTSKNEIKRKAESKEVLITIATFSIATEGTNVKSWERGFLAGTIANEKDLIQCIGRLRRTKKGKENVVIYDYHFPNVAGAKNHFDKRKEVYKENKFII